MTLPTGADAPVWQLLDAPDGTHVHVLDPDFVPNGLFDIMVDVPHEVLDVGCYCAGAGAALKRRWPGVRVTGIEPVGRAADIAATRIDHVFRGTLQQATPASLAAPARGFDTIICADVLEHMHNPWSALTQLRALLSNDGVVIACIPNVRNIGLLADLACCGRFDYASAGLLDVTHIRFFTEQGVRAMFAQTGFAIEAFLHFLDPRYVGLVEPPSTSPNTIQLPSLTLTDLTPEDRRELATMQFVVRASKSG